MHFTPTGDREAKCAEVGCKFIMVCAGSDPVLYALLPNRKPGIIYENNPIGRDLIYEIEYSVDPNWETVFYSTVEGFCEYDEMFPQDQCISSYSNHTCSCKANGDERPTYTYAREGYCDGYEKLLVEFDNHGSLQDIRQRCAAHCRGYVGFMVFEDTYGSYPGSYGRCFCTTVRGQCSESASADISLEFSGHCGAYVFSTNIQASGTDQCSSHCSAYQGFILYSGGSCYCTNDLSTCSADYRNSKVGWNTYRHVLTRRIGWHSYDYGTTEVECHKQCGSYCDADGLTREECEDYATRTGYAFRVSTAHEGLPFGCSVKGSVFWVEDWSSDGRHFPGCYHHTDNSKFCVQAIDNWVRCYGDKSGCLWGQQDCETHADCLVHSVHITAVFSEYVEYLPRGGRRLALGRVWATFAHLRGCPVTPQ